MPEQKSKGRAMTNHYETIRAALEGARTTARICVLGGLAKETDDALSALAELEKAASEPALTRHSLVMVPVTPTDAMINAACYLLPSVPRVCMDDAIERAIAAAPPVPTVEVTSELCLRVNRRWMREPGITDEDCGREMIAAVQAELGPALGLTAWREPTEEECERIYSFWISAEGCIGRTPGERMGRIMFAAVREVMGGGE